jgi:hypothetical protein
MFESKTQDKWDSPFGRAHQALCYLPHLVQKLEDIHKQPYTMLDIISGKWVEVLAC